MRQILFLFGVMGVSIEAYRAAIGLFNSTKFTILCFKCPWKSLIVLLDVFFFFVYFICIKIILSNEIEINPGPSRFLSFEHFNKR
jgi:hypothetical protein